MGGDVEDQVRAFYDSDGWVTRSGKSGEDRYFRGVRGGRGRYGELVARQLSELLQGVGGTLLIAGGGDLPRSHLLAAAPFDKVVCVDISAQAIAIAREKLGDRGEYHVASILAIPLPEASVDAVLCSHMLYHIDAAQQATAVRELIRVTRPGGAIVIVYLNPRSPLMLVQGALKALGVNRLLGMARLYLHAFPTGWWRQFAGSGRIRILPYDCMTANQARAMLPAAALRRVVYAWAYRMQTRRAGLAARLWTAIAIEIRKGAGTA
jgi:SAM-dependent methyltransferase